MTPFPCPHCGQLHDLADVEPSFRRPDAYLEIPPEEKGHRVSESDEGCLIAFDGGTHLRTFLRAMLYVPILGDPRPIGWGIWVEVPAPEYFRLVNLADDPKQPDSPPAPGTLANELPSLSGTLGLPGSLRLTSPTTRPHFSFDAGVDHPFAHEAREGVRPERAMEWRLRAVHPAEATG